MPSTSSRFWHWFTGKHRHKNTANEDSKINQTHDPKLKQIEKIFKELECPVCFNTCTPPIYTCQGGHIICSNCRPNVTLCPTCHKQLGGTRNFFAEHFIAQYSQSCKYARDGCTFLRWKGDDMKGHEKTCFYRPIPCIVPSCSTAIRYKFLLDHLTDTHKVFGSETLPTSITFHTDDPLIADRQWLPYYIKAFDTNFFLMMEVIRPHFWVWIWTQTPKKEITNNTLFIASLQFLNEEKNLCLEWRGPVFSIRTPSCLITQDGLCFGGAESLLQHFEVDGLIRLNVNIEKRVLTPKDRSAPPKNDSNGNKLSLSRSVASIKSTGRSDHSLRRSRQNSEQDPLDVEEATPSDNAIN